MARRKTEIRFPAGEKYAEVSYYSRGEICWAKVDPQDVDMLSQHSWRANAKGYVLSSYGMRMHRMLLGDPIQSKVWDHINGDPADNRRANLRLVTPQQNSANTRPHRGGSATWKGVSWNKSNSNWRAQITVNGTNRCLGSFKTDIEAAAAYNAAARAAWGEYALLNGITYPAAIEQNQDQAPSELDLPHLHG